VAVAYTSEQAKQDPALVLQQQQQQATAAQQGVLAAAERLDLDEVWVPYRWPGQLGGKEVYISGEGGACRGTSPASCSKAACSEATGTFWT
jgi:transcription initiation factor TFIID subunit TAF12